MVKKGNIDMSVKNHSFSESETDEKIRVSGSGIDEKS